MADLTALPEDLPPPIDDGGAAHLLNMELPQLSLNAHDEDKIQLNTFNGTTVIYCYPMTRHPAKPLPDGWDMIPGARGCTPQSCAFRDHKQKLNALGVSQIFGISIQTQAEQYEAAERLHLPFQLLSDAELHLQ